MVVPSLRVTVLSWDLSALPEAVGELSMLDAAEPTLLDAAETTELAAADVVDVEPEEQADTSSPYGRYRSSQPPGHGPPMTRCQHGSPPREGQSG
jgi:hypothetical protein